MTDTPRTEAGRRLLDGLHGSLSDQQHRALVTSVLAIEAEAAAGPRDTERVVRDMRYHPSLSGKSEDYIAGWDAAAVLLAEDAAGPRDCSWPEKACALDRMVEAGAVPLERLDAIDAAGPRKHREGVWGPSGYGKGVCEVDGEPWPCKAAAGPRDEGLREWLDSPLRDYLDERDRAYLAALAGASE